MTASEIERLIFHMPSVAIRAESGFAHDFATSIVRQSKRRGWWPSKKQLPVMRELVSDLFTGSSNYGGDFDLIE